MDADITVKIRAKALLTPSTADNQSGEDTYLRGTEADHSGKGFSRSGIILQSVALPGLGLTRMNGQPHWIRGVAGYGCITGSILLNRKAISTYEQYLAGTAADDADEHFQTADRQDAISEALAYVAIGIWVTDVVWTVLGTSGLTNKPVTGRTRGFSSGMGFDPLSGAPLIGIRYGF
jgi:hypothetical protein